MNFLNERAKKEILNKVYTLNKIEVKPGKCRFNYKCQMNSVHEAIKKGDDSIVMCFYIDEDYPIIHFLNYRKDKYIDNTLGHWVNHYEFYFIRFIPKESFFKVNSIFTEYRKELKRNMSFFNRIFSNVEF